MPYQVNPPGLLNTIAQSLVDSGNYDPNPDGTTKCNLFLSDFAIQAYQYQGFGGKLANEIVDYLRTAVDDWKMVFELASSVPLDKALDDAQQIANQGFFVVIGLKVVNGRGHVAVVVNGISQNSSTWANAGLPGKVPIIAQAGGDALLRQITSLRNFAT